jgi:hypothetical protein
MESPSVNFHKATKFFFLIPQKYYLTKSIYCIYINTEYFKALSSAPEVPCIHQVFITNIRKLKRTVHTKFREIRSAQFKVVRHMSLCERRLNTHLKTRFYRYSRFICHRKGSSSTLYEHGNELSQKAVKFLHQLSDYQLLTVALLHSFNAPLLPCGP